MKNWRVIWPCLISSVRLLAAPFVALYALNGDWWTSTWLLGGAWMTDPLDGWIANRLKAESAFGRYFDRFCDAALNTGTIFGLLQGSERPYVFALGFATLVSFACLAFFKDKGSTPEIRVRSAKISFVYFEAVVAIVSNIYTYRAFNWGWIGILLTIPVVYLLRRGKSRRIARLHSLGF